MVDLQVQVKGVSQSNNELPKQSFFKYVGVMHDYIYVKVNVLSP